MYGGDFPPTKGIFVRVVLKKISITLFCSHSFFKVAEFV